MYTESNTQFTDIDSFDEGYEEDDSEELIGTNLHDDVYSNCSIKKEQAEHNDDDDFVNCNDDDYKPGVTDETVDSYTKTVERLESNKSTTKETVASFKKAVKALKDFDEKELQKELEAGAKEGKVHSLVVLMHLKEALQESGFKVIAFQPDPETGSVVLKNDKTETYVQMQFSREKGKERASVKIETKK